MIYVIKVDSCIVNVLLSVFRKTPLIQGSYRSGNLKYQVKSGNVLLYIRFLVIIANEEIFNYSFTQEKKNYIKFMQTM